jgi:hypothetical protein
VHYSIFEGVYFVEGKPTRARTLGPVVVEVGGVFHHAQLRTLNDVKRAMAAKVRMTAGNAIIDFKYGQRSVGFWKSLFHMDDVTWYGSGQIAILAPADVA